MFERFSKQAIKAVMLAQEEARRLGHNFVGAQFMLLGLLGEGTSVAAKSLKAQGINLRETRRKAEEILGRGSGRVAVEIPLTVELHKAFKSASDLAARIGTSQIEAEHVLLGILGNEDPVLSRILSELGSDTERLERHLTAMIGLDSRLVAGHRNEPNEQLEARQEPGVDESSRPQQEAAKVDCPQCHESIHPQATRCKYCNHGLSERHFKLCQYCFESIKIQATKCRYCHSQLNDNK